MLPQSGPCFPLSVRRPAAAAEGTRQPRLGLRTQTHCRCPCCCSRGISVHGIVVGVQRTVRASGIRLGELSCVRPRENPAASSAVRGQHCAQWTTGRCLLRSGHKLHACCYAQPVALTCAPDSVSCSTMPLPVGYTTVASFRNCTSPPALPITAKLVALSCSMLVPQQDDAPRALW